MAQRDYYNLLGLKKVASEAEIKVPSKESDHHSHRGRSLINRFLGVFS